MTQIVVVFCLAVAAAVVVFLVVDYLQHRGGAERRNSVQPIADVVEPTDAAGIRHLHHVAGQMAERAAVIVRRKNKTPETVATPLGAVKADVRPDTAIMPMIAPAHDYPTMPLRSVPASIETAQLAAERPLTAAPDASTLKLAHVVDGLPERQVAETGERYEKVILVDHSGDHYSLRRRTGPRRS